MASRRYICKVLRDGARRSIHPIAPTASCMAPLNSIDSLRFCRLPLDGSIRCLGGSKICPKEESLLSNYLGASCFGESCTESVPFSSQMRNFSGTYGVGPVGGADRDPKSKGDTPDDFRADAIHMAEPKEIAKEKAAEAMEEPPDFQVKKLKPEWDKQAVNEADSQREPGDTVFEGKTRKLEGTAQYEGDTTGTESSGEEVQGQYGAGSSEGKTSRS